MPQCKANTHPSATEMQGLQSWAALQDGDDVALDAALIPALAAIAAGAHKQPPSACSRDRAEQLPFFMRYSAAWVHTSMATVAVSRMEKQKQYRQAADLLQQLLGEGLQHDHMLADLVLLVQLSCW